MLVSSLGYQIGKMVLGNMVNGCFRLFNCQILEVFQLDFLLSKLYSRFIAKSGPSQLETYLVDILPP